MTTSELITNLLEAGVHFGHQTKRWNPKMRRFIFGERSGIYIINLQQTEHLLAQACAFLTERTSRGERILFVGTKRQAKHIIREEASRADMHYVVNRWLGGTLTNFQTICASVKRLRELQALRDSGGLELRSKKEAMQLTKELTRLEYNLEGIDTMRRLPCALFVVDPHREAIAVHEANRLDIPVVAVCDTNCDPDLIAHPIPGNDDAMRAIQFLTAKIAQACTAGRQQWIAAQPVEPIKGTASDEEPDSPVVETSMGDEGDNAQEPDLPAEIPLATKTEAAPLVAKTKPKRPRTYTKKRGSATAFKDSRG